MMEKFNFDVVFFRRFTGLLRRTRSATICLMIAYLLLLAILNEMAVYNVGMITGEYYKVLGDKDWYKFWLQTIKALVLIISLALIKSSKEYVASNVQIEWRRRLTQLIHLNYFSNLAYYKLNVINREKDNLDQRITQDIQEFCQHLSVVLPDLIISPFIIAFYTYRLFVTIGYIGPLGCLIFFSFSTFLNRTLISLVLKWVYLQQKCEGDFRYEHIHVRNCAESIAFLSGHTFEYKKSEKLFNKLISVQENLILKQFYLKSSVYLSDYLGTIVSFLILSFPLFTGKYDTYSVSDLSQLISQNAFVTMYLINCFTRLIDTSTDFATIGGTTHRIAEVFESFEENQNLSSGEEYNESLNHLSDDCPKSAKTNKLYLKLTDVSIGAPKSDRLLIINLNLEISDSTSLLISGDSGTAKTSILRVLKGLWKEREGSVDRYLDFDDPKTVIFLPQTPVMTIGSLLEQISYPLEPKHIRSEDPLYEKQIRNLMKFLQLDEILDRIENDIEKSVDWNWADCLSPGEQQRISFVRLFFHRPLLAVLDESTSAVSVEMERKIYEECKRLKICLISCGHRQSLREYHSIVMKIVKNDNQNDLIANQYTLQML